MGVVEIEATQERREGKIWDFGVWAVKEMGMERLLFFTGLVVHIERQTPFVKECMHVIGKLVCRLLILAIWGVFRPFLAQSQPLDLVGQMDMVGHD